ncbi:MAG: Dolichyl-phosphate-mannose-protein mannosyltransferase [Acidobacteriota bacterium]|nr:Dolichyl-phosphate-mannose-protein mannosyltransferase [Acidobacteriota bacterium]
MNEGGEVAVGVVAPMTLRRAWAIDRATVATLTLLFVFGFGLRVSGIGAVGFAEDEINKLAAIDAYARGDITPNAEHPMLMKTMMLVSVGAAHWWNERSLPGDTLDVLDVSDEAALRFPNVLFGALTILPLFLLTHSLFDRRTALLAAAFWAVGVNAITYNRIAKEDTLLVFFMLFAFYFYIRAKQTSGFEPKLKNRFYTWSGVSFGLMLASKYFPHYFGLNMLYHHYARLRRRGPGEPAGHTPGAFYLVALIAFLVANPSIFLPQTWHYINIYSSEQLLTHHGYLFGDTLYANHVSSTPFGTPFYFYLLFLAIKLPLPVVAAMLAGFALCVRRWRASGAFFVLLMFLLWIIPYSIMGAKWLRYTLSLMPFVYMLAAVGVAALLGRASSLFKRGEGLLAPARVVNAVVLIIFIALPAWAALKSRPHYALYTNALASSRAGHFFPHDEFYDDGLREAIKFVAENAPQGSTIVHETPGVTSYYLQQFNRADINSRVLSDTQFKLDDAPRPAYFILQRGRTYFENREKMDEVRARFPRINVVAIDGIVAAEIYEAH